MGRNKVEEATVEVSPDVYSTSGAKRRENTPPETPMLWAISACADPTAALSAYAELAGLPDPAALALPFRDISGSIEMIARSEGSMRK